MTLMKRAAQVVEPGCVREKTLNSLDAFHAYGSGFQINTVLGAQYESPLVLDAGEGPLRDASFTRAFEFRI